MRSKNLGENLHRSFSVTFFTFQKRQNVIFNGNFFFKEILITLINVIIFLLSECWEKLHLSNRICVNGLRCTAQRWKKCFTTNQTVLYFAPLLQKALSSCISPLLLWLMTLARYFSICVHCKSKKWLQKWFEVNLSRYFNELKFGRWFRMLMSIAIENMCNTRREYKMWPDGRSHNLTIDKFRANSCLFHTHLSHIVRCYICVAVSWVRPHARGSECLRIFGVLTHTHNSIAFFVAVTKTKFPQ